MNRLKKLSSSVQEDKKTIEYFINSFDLAKSLISELPIVPTNDRVYELVQDIERGDYDDIAPIDKAHEHWEEYIKRTRDILKARRILV